MQIHFWIYQWEVWMSDVKHRRIQSSGWWDGVRKDQRRRKGCFHNFDCSIEFEERVAVRKVMITQQAVTKTTMKSLIQNRVVFEVVFGGRKGVEKRVKKGLFFGPLEKLDRRHMGKKRPKTLFWGVEQPAGCTFARNLENGPKSTFLGCFGDPSKNGLFWALIENSVFMTTKLHATLLNNTFITSLKH